MAQNAVNADIDRNGDMSEQIQVYPNPNHGLFYIEYDSRIFGKTIITVVNILGEDVRKYEIRETNSTVKHQIDIQDLHCGLYFIRIKPQKGKEIYKRVIFDKSS